MKYLFTLSSLLIAMLFSNAVWAADDWRLSSAGYGPLEPGMTAKQAESLLGSKLITASEGPPGSACKFMAVAQGHAGVTLMLQQGRITHIEANSPGILTKSGVAVGDSSAKLKRLFGKQLEIEMHKYDEKGFYYFLWDAKRSRGMKFEIANDKVETIYAGSKTISLVEGCN
ncbi:MAG: hypothetical protein NTY70_09545 [Burkholderiales bacterium]|nr:hypothetical protein [Burkholderiales bacterium]